MDWANQFIVFIGLQSAFALIIGLCIWPIARTFRKRSSFLVILLWSVVLLRLVMPTDLASEYSLRSAIEWIADSENTTEIRIVMNAPLAEELSTEVVNHELVVRNTSEVSWLFWVWLIGFLSCMAFFAYLRRPYKQFVKVSLPVDCPVTLGMVENYRKSLGIYRQVNIRSAAANTPFTIGFLHPTILIPSKLISEEKYSVVECIIAHEMHHIRHWDALWLHAQQALQCVYFFNPMVWYANASIHRARECLRDSQALRTGHINMRSYGEALLYFSTSDSTASKKYKSYPAFAASDNQLKRRIEYMIKQKDTRMKNTFAFLVVCL
ncbi:MAG: M56 family metallopeptidase, partial [Calditrichota bacterium]